MLYNIVSKESLLQLFKYCLVSVGGYIFITTMMYTLVDFIGIHPKVSFFLVYSAAYISEYFLNLKMLFGASHSWKKLCKFCLHVAIFLTLGSALFGALFNFGLHYLIATVMTTVILFPVRFLAHKFIVFR